MAAPRGTEWLDWQLELLRTRFADTHTKDLAVLIGRAVSSVSHKSYQLKLKKSPEILSLRTAGITRFKPIGSERINPDGYLMRKVNNDYPLNARYKCVHIIEWEQCHGPVPEGFVVILKDGDRRNTDIGNLDLINRQEVMKRNTINRYPDEVKALIRLQRKLERTIERKEDA
jgi:hypothetical protein